MIITVFETRDDLKTGVCLGLIEYMPGSVEHNRITRDSIQIIDSKSSRTDDYT